MKDKIQELTAEQTKLNKNLFKHTLNFGIGSILPKAIGFFLIPVYTHYLTPEDFGVVDLATSFGAFLLVFMRLGIPGSVTRFYYEHRESTALNDYITTIFWFLIGCSLVIGALAWLVLKFGIDVLIPGLPFYPFIIMIIGWAFFNSNTDLQRRLLQVKEQSAYSARLSTITAIITIALTLVFVITFKLGAVGVIAATLVSALIFFIQGQLYLNPYLKGTFKLQHLAPSFTYALGILPYHLVSNAAPIVSKSILAGYESVAMVGVYGIALRFSTPMTLFTGALQNAFTPIYYSIRTEQGESAEGKRQIGELVVRIWSVALLILAGLICFGGFGIKLLVSSEFYAAIHVFPWLCISLTIGLASYIFGNEIYYSKKTYWIAIISFINVGLNIIFLLVLIPHYGLLATVYAMVLSAGISGGMQIYLSRRFYAFILPWRKLFISFLLIIALFVIQYFLDISWHYALFLGSSGIVFILFIVGLFYFELLRKKDIPFLNKFV